MFLHSGNSKLSGTSRVWGMNVYDVFTLLIAHEAGMVDDRPV